MEADIPIWLSGQLIIMKGVDGKTTCGQVILAVVGKESDEWTMVERWKEVERPLRHKARILKVWNQWANEKDQVKLAIRKQAKKKPRKFRSEKNNIERLLELILTQGETIQNHLHVLTSKEDDKVFVDNTSGISDQTPGSTETTPTHTNAESYGEQTPEKLSQLVEYYEKISKLNKNIEKQEEIIVKLHFQIKKHAEKNRITLIEKIKQLKIQNDSWYKELEYSSNSLKNTDQSICEKTQYLQGLYEELHQTGLETKQLMNIKDKMECIVKEKEISSDADTNSDTGLSSLHSSSEEGTFIMESAL